MTFQWWPDLVPCTCIPHSHCFVIRCGIHPMSPPQLIAAPNTGLEFPVSSIAGERRTVYLGAYFPGRYRRMLQIQNPTVEWRHSRNSIIFLQLGLKSTLLTQRPNFHPLLIPVRVFHTGIVLFHDTVAVYKRLGQNESLEIFSGVFEKYTFRLAV